MRSFVPTPGKLGASDPKGGLTLPQPVPPPLQMFGQGTGNNQGIPIQQNVSTHSNTQNSQWQAFANTIPTADTGGSATVQHTHSHEGYPPPRGIQHPGHSQMETKPSLHGFQPPVPSRILTRPSLHWVQPPGPSQMPPPPSLHGVQPPGPSQMHWPTHRHLRRLNSCLLHPPGL